MTPAMQPDHRKTGEIADTSTEAPTNDIRILS
jgi:hypothetical protein